MNAIQRMMKRANSTAKKKVEGEEPEDEMVDVEDEDEATLNVDDLAVDDEEKMEVDGDIVDEDDEEEDPKKDGSSMSEKTRIKSILGGKDADAFPALAQAIACDTSLSARQSQSLISAAAKDVVAAIPAGEKSRLSARMSGRASSTLKRTGTSVDQAEEKSVSDRRQASRDGYKARMKGGRQ